MNKCKNCGIESGGTYCPECGQEVEPKRMTVKLVFKDSTHKFLHWENPSLNTIRQLLMWPGRTAKNYISGAKKSLIKPYKFFLSWQTIHVIFFHWLSKNYFNYQIATSDYNPAERKEMQMIQQIMNENIKDFDYLLPLFFAYIFYLFYRKKTGINFAESLSVSFYWISVTLIFSIIFMLLSLIYVKLWVVPIFINLIFLTFASIRLSGDMKLSGALKGLTVVILSYAMYLTFVVTLILVFEYNFHK
ncbi:MAG: DUF3667 domain-containing protein [Ignavibacteriae bacterium]|nr:DUF3667 domain-containing protein [Ignavibacteriota bacterium]